MKGGCDDRVAICVKYMDYVIDSMAYCKVFSMVFGCFKERHVWWLGVIGKGVGGGWEHFLYSYVALCKGCPMCVCLLWGMSVR